MKMRRSVASFSSAVLGLSLGLANPAHATVVGYFGDANAATPITLDGFTGVLLTNLTAADLAGINVLWIFNPNNGAPSTTITNNLPAITTFVQNGGVLSYADRNVNQGLSASTYLPGGGGISFTSSLSTNIDIQTPGTLVTNGPGGIITNTNLDGGNLSNHGFATLASLPAGAVAILNNGTAGQIVDFYYRFGLGAVYYSSIPLDFYLDGGGNNPPADAFRNIYARNEAAFQASLATVTPEPGTFVLLVSGFFGLGGITVVRRRRNRVDSVSNIAA